jgi:hypothetical protein
MAVEYSKGHEKYQHSKTLQNIPKVGFWYENKPSGNPGDVGTLMVCSIKRLHSKAVGRETHFLHVQKSFGWSNLK